MKRLKLVPASDKILKQKARDITQFDSSLNSLVQQMYALMMQNKGVGIAAPQVGIGRRVIIVWDGKETTKPVVCINPEILEYLGDEVKMLEGCLSYPGIRKEISRPEGCRVKYQNLKGEVLTEEVHGILCRCLQHELDHLNGITIISR